MADRSVVVGLRADVGDFTTKVRTAGTVASGSFDEAARSASRLADVQRGIGVGLLAIGTAAAIGIGTAIGFSADFDQGLSHVQAATHETAAGMGQIGAAALEAGKSTVFSATESLGAVEQLGKAGLSTADILGGGLTGALDLAAAGGIGVAEAAETAATALSIFNLEGSQTEHVADLLAAAAGKAQGGVSDMSAAFNQSALVAKQVGLTIEQTTGTLALFASAGLLGSDAGTSFRTMLLRLTNPTEEAAQQMRDLGLNVYDAQGQFVGMESIAGQLQTRMGGLDEETRNAALGTIFGSDAIRAASILYSGGADAVKLWETNVNDAGYAAETAAIRTDNLRGDIEQLGGAWETAMIKIGEGSDGALRGTVQLLTDMINVVGGAPPIVQKTILVVGGLTAAVGLAGGAAFLAAPKIIAFNSAIAQMRAAESTASVQRLGGAMSALSKAIPIVGGVLAVGTIALGIFGAAHGDVVESEQALRDSLDQTTGAITDQTRALVASEVQASGMIDLARQLGLQAGTLTDAILGDPESIDEVAAAVERVKQAWREAYDPANATGVTDELRDQFNAATALEAKYPQLADRLSEQIQAQRDVAAEMRGTAEAGTVVTTTLDGIMAASSATTGAVDDLTGTYQDHQATTEDLSDEESILAERLGLTAQAAMDLADSMSAANRQQEILTGGNVAVIETSIAYNQALTDADETIQKIKDDTKKYGEVIDSATGSISETTLAGQELSGQLIDIRDRTLEHADAIREQTNDEAQSNAVIAAGRQALFDKVAGYFASETAAWAYVDSILAIPVDVATDVDVDDNGTIADVQRRIDELHGKTVFMELEWQIGHLPEGWDEPGGRTGSTGIGTGRAMGAQSLAAGIGAGVGAMGAGTPAAPFDFSTIRMAAPVFVQQQRSGGDMSALADRIADALKSSNRGWSGDLVVQYPINEATSTATGRVADLVAALA